jgi:GNAT superfamily N-acetyltransferase
VQVGSPGTDLEWRQAQALVNALIDWDASQSRPLGFSRAEVAAAFYPDSMADIRAHSVAPRGRFLLATQAHDPAGCAAFKQLSADVCELYCVYVRPESRGHGVGSLLLGRLQAEASVAGYTAMYLETATFMHDAHALYRSHGFGIRGHYRPLADKYANVTVAMQCDLGSAARLAG